MKSIARIVTVLAVLFVPTLAFGQQVQTFTQTIPGISSQTSQFYSGGVSGIPGGGLFGFGGGSFGVGGLGLRIIAIINNVLVPLLFALSFIVFLYGVAKSYILSSGDEEAVKSGHKIILWGLIGFAVMISVWGLVNVVVNTFGLTGLMPRIPTSISPFGGLPLR